KQPLQESVEAPGKLILMLSACALAISPCFNWDILFSDHLPLWLRCCLIPFGQGLVKTMACFAIGGFFIARLRRTNQGSGDWLNTCGLSLGALWVVLACTEPFLSLEVLRWLGATS
ncbi:MAG: hypothetical protein AAGJ83_02810, partial [Planctomycetota bacterium]